MNATRTEAAAVEPSSRRLDGWTIFALLMALVAFPVGWSSGYIGPLIVEIYRGSRTHWWYFWLLGLAFHGLPFLAVWTALRRNGQPWSSIGVDWGWFRRWWWFFAGLMAVLVATAFIVPGVYYLDGLPKLAQSNPQFMIPITAPERLFILLIALTAGVTEEVLFRGFAITRLSRVLGSPWLALPVTVVSFIFIHGKPRSVEMLIAYTAAGLGFGVPFILMKQRRLEALIFIHFLIDASMVFAP